MSPASHGVGRLHRLYGVVLGRMSPARERIIEPSTPYVFVEPMEPRMLLSGFTPADLSALPYRQGMGYQVSAGCFYNPPASETASGQAGLAAAPPAGQRPFGATADDTSEYMAGDVYVTVVLLQSNGAIDPSTQTWTAGEIANVKNEINEGLTWWQTTYANTGYSGSLHFTADFTYANTPFRTSYEPIDRSADDQNLWIDQFLTAQGSGSGEAGQRAFDDAQRLAHNTDWAYTVFVVDSSGTANGTFTNGYFAYAYLGGPIAVMTYDNGGWGINKMGQVFAHESAHIFYALDEYYQPGYGGSSYYDYSGYYNTQNTNGAMDRPGSAGAQDNSLMGDEALQNAAYAAHTSSTPSLEMIGWKDSDGDDIIDVLDYPMTLTGSGSYNQGQRNYTFTGTSTVQGLGNLNPNGLAHDITLNEVDGVQYSVDNGPWLDTAAQYGTTTATINVTVGPLPMSTTHLAFRTISRESGAVSNVVSDSFAPPGAPTNVSPANHATDINLVPTLAIAPITGSNGGVSLAARWLLWRASDSVTVFDSGIDSVNTTSCPVPPDTLEFATIYSWIVRYQGASGLWSGYSAVTSFTTMAKPSTASDKPVNIAPTDKSTRASTTPTLSASTFHDPAGHTFVTARWILRRTSDNALIHDVQTPAQDGFTLTLPPGALAYATSYSWSVMYLDTGSEWGDPSNATTFTTRKGPPVMLDQGLSVPENSSNGSVVGVVRAWSPDLGLTLQYAIIGGNTGDAFTIDPANGQITVATSSALDYESLHSIALSVRVTDNCTTPASATAVVTVALTDVNDAPTDITLSRNSVWENRPAGTIVGALAATDPDAVGTFTYLLAPGAGAADNARFAIVGNTLKTTAIFDYETRDSYSIRVRTTDQGGLYTEKQFTVTVVPVTDLTPTAVDSSVNQSATPGAAETWTATIKNLGPALQQADWTLEWYLSLDALYQPTDTLVARQTYSDDIAPGASINKALAANVPAIPLLGQKVLIARVVNSGADALATNDVKATLDKDWFGAVAAPAGDPIDVDLGYVAGTTVRPGGKLGTPGQKALYHFTTLAPGLAANFAQIAFLNIEGDLYLKLFQADGVTQIGLTVNTVANIEKLSLAGLPEGSYCLEVGGTNGDVSPNYTLTLAAPPSPDLMPTLAGSSVNQSAAPGTSVDWSVTVKNNGLGRQRADWTVQWYLSPTAAYKPATAVLVASQTYSDDIPAAGSVSKTFTAPVPALALAGQKFVIAHVVNAGPEANVKNDYKGSLEADWFGPVLPDAADAAARNDAFASATALGAVSGALARPGLTVDSIDAASGALGGDWYSFTLGKVGTALDKARIDFLNIEGDLTLRLVDSGANVIQTSDTAGNFEQISLNTLAPGAYWLQILGKNNDLSRSYALSLRTPI